MAAVLKARTPDMDEKVKLMREDARFELDEPTSEEMKSLSETRDGIRSRPAPPTVPKVFMSNECSFNCAYCGCRAGNECKTRYSLDPRTLGSYAVKEAIRHNRGIFLTSAIWKNANYTQELIIETLRVIREELRFPGYVHAKVMPGADDELIRRAGLLANRLSVNIEVAHSDGYQRVARNKSKQNILSPMARISELIATAKLDKSPLKPRFATSQTTQLMAGSCDEDDRQILTLSSALYKKYRLSRVYYTPFHYTKPARGYDLPFIATPYWRMRRLYQADRLLAQYGFTPDEIAPSEAGFLRPEIDPKLSWALRNLQLFPIEVNRADYESLIRVPGIGDVYARRIIEARRRCVLSQAHLKQLGVALKRSQHFITCNGKYEGVSLDDPDRIHELLAEPQEVWDKHAQLEFC